MTTKNVTVEVGKETHELATALANVLLKGKEVLDDGFQPGQDLPELAVVAMQEFLTGLSGVGDIPTELKVNPEAFINALYTALVPVVFELANG